MIGIGIVIGIGIGIGIGIVICTDTDWVELHLEGAMFGATASARAWFRCNSPLLCQEIPVLL